MCGRREHARHAYLHKLSTATLPAAQHECSAGGVHGRRGRVPRLHHGGAAATESHRRGAIIAVGDGAGLRALRAGTAGNQRKNGLCPGAAPDCKPSTAGRCSQALLTHVRKGAAWLLGSGSKSDFSLHHTEANLVPESGVTTLVMQEASLRKAAGSIGCNADRPREVVQANDTLHTSVMLTGRAGGVCSVWSRRAPTSELQGTR